MLCGVCEQTVPDISKTLQSSEVLRTVYSAVQHNIPEALNLQQHNCGNIQSHRNDFIGRLQMPVTSLAAQNGV
jgi:hypothetical protein